ncbi:hypothetical protein Adt_34119 [Abeliophyllum distichum]|uniref:Uncharacterized protein n=1 Tax=Abeliophyllum distichum TaxID=126358 RepID=A0ABD1QYB1_9LAMI
MDALSKVASSGVSDDECAIAREVLRERQVHVCRVGQVSKGSSHSLNSAAASNTPRGTSNQFCKDAQNDDIWFAMYEVQLSRMERTIARLTVNLQQRLSGIVPEDYKEVGEDENDEISKSRECYRRALRDFSEMSKSG